MVVTMQHECAAQIGSRHASNLDSRLLVCLAAELLGDPPQLSKLLIRLRAGCALSTIGTA
jgi:hypothetical protein